MREYGHHCQSGISVSSEITKVGRLNSPQFRLTFDKKLKKEEIKNPTRLSYNHLKSMFFMEKYIYCCSYIDWNIFVFI